ncbi:MAG: hypothetical protein GF313_01855 [Caldithrix sp.]|nr:hypothetical protein [Caldithrix sp.]
MSSLQSNSANKFEIGLVMAGAISAGAYSAGVIDFLIQALEEMANAKQNFPDEAPRHEVSISVISGASAGGMTAALMTSMFNEEYQPITTLPAALPDNSLIKKNKLYDVWVEQIDIDGLLQTDDLQRDNEQVRSLLNSPILNTIAENALHLRPSSEKRPYITTPLHLYLTLTNLRGIPYTIDFEGGQGSGHHLAAHKDYFHFAMGNQSNSDQDCVWLDPSQPSHSHWQLFKQCALATGAFPIGLAPRFISRPAKHYETRKWPIPQENGQADGCIRMDTIAPSWSDNTVHKNGEYSFLAVDGGVIDNEPLELARRQLSADRLSNPRRAREANRAVLLIDPFPAMDIMSADESGASADFDILQTGMKLFTSLKNQARFKPEELKLALNDDVFSRFLIAPSRRLSNGSAARYPIASGCMGGFGGFLHKLFRVHDFQLGRRNCQKFLQDHFVIPMEEAKRNPIFAEYDEQAFNRIKRTVDGKDMVPIIPLAGRATEQEFTLAWDGIKVNQSFIEALQRKIDKRSKKVAYRLIDKKIDGLFKKNLSKLVYLWKGDTLIQGIVKKIENDLVKFDLFSRSSM